MPKRRVPICTINWCCPYRADLCGERCTGERKPRDDYMVVHGDYMVMRDDGERKYYRYRIPERTKEAFKQFDRGDPVDEGTYRFEAPRPTITRGPV
jgi:hypothetical protein